MYIHVKPEDCHEILEKTVLGGEIIDRLVYHLDGVAYPPAGGHPLLQEAHRVVLENCGSGDAEDIEEYIAKGGYAGFEKALFEMTDEEICRSIIDSGLGAAERWRLPRGPEVGRCPETEVREKIHRLQRRRGRSRCVHGPLHYGG